VIKILEKISAFVAKFWAPIAIAVAVMLLGGGKVKRADRRAKDAGDAFRNEVRSDMDDLAEENQQAKTRADAAIQDAKKAKQKFRDNVHEISNSNDSLSDILSDYDAERMRDKSGTTRL